MSQFFQSEYFNKPFFKQPFFQENDFFKEPFFDGLTTQAPTGFENPTASNVSATGFTVNWVAPTGGDSVDNYIVSVSQSGTPIAGSPFTMAGSTLQKVVSGLVASTEYHFQVSAVNVGGSAESGIELVTTNA